MILYTRLQLFFLIVCFGIPIDSRVVLSNNMETYNDYVLYLYNDLVYAIIPQSSHPAKL